VRVLFTSHTGHVSGGEHSLLDLLAALPPSVPAEVACPPGDLARRLPHSHRIAGTDASLRLHPLYTPRAAARMASAGFRVRKIARRTGAELVHANSIRAGLVALVARALGGPPVVVHVRDRLPRGRVGRLALALLTRHAAAVVGNSEYTLDGVPEGGRAIRAAIPSPVDLARFDPDRVDGARARRRLGLNEDTPVLGIVGQLTPWKAQDDAIRILHRVRATLPSAMLLVAGTAKFVSQETRYDNRTFVSGLHAMCADLGLHGAVRFLGEREDVPELLAALDVLLVPSWAEPFGRVVIEGMAMGLPVIATSEGGPAEIIDDGLDGVLLPPRAPERWAHEVRRLLEDRERARGLAEVARRRVGPTYGVEAHVRRILNVYGQVLGSRPAAPATSSEPHRSFL
jgi:glycosyltransferase involved in cell wall biosynthesis